MGLGQVKLGPLEQKDPRGEFWRSRRSSCVGAMNNWTNQTCRSSGSQGRRGLRVAWWTMKKAVFSSCPALTIPLLLLDTATPASISSASVCLCSSTAPPFSTSSRLAPPLSSSAKPEVAKPLKFLRSSSSKFKFKCKFHVTNSLHCALQYLKEAGWAAGGRLIACTQPRWLSVQVTSSHHITHSSFTVLFGR